MAHVYWATRPQPAHLAAFVLLPEWPRLYSQSRENGGGSTLGLPPQVWRALRGEHRDAVGRATARPADDRPAGKPHCARSPAISSVGGWRTTDRAVRTSNGDPG